MSKQRLTRVTVPRAEIQKMFMSMMPDKVDLAIVKVQGWRCPGPVFPTVHRAWMSHSAFQVA